MPLFRRAKIISNFDLIIDCTEKLLDNWRTFSNEHIHCNIVQQCQNLLLQIFGLIAFDYDLEIVDSKSAADDNELTPALQDLLNAFQTILYLPSFLAIVYSKLSYRYQRARMIIKRNCDQMIEQELVKSPEEIAKRKRISVIASLVASLQKVEYVESKKK